MPGPQGDFVSFLVKALSDQPEIQKGLDSSPSLWSREDFARRAPWEMLSGDVKGSKQAIMSGGPAPLLSAEEAMNSVFDILYAGTVTPSTKSLVQAIKAMPLAKGAIEDMILAARYMVNNGKARGFNEETMLVYNTALQAIEQVAKGLVK